MSLFLLLMTMNVVYLLRVSIRLSKENVLQILDRFHTTTFSLKTNPNSNLRRTPTPTTLPRTPLEDPTTFTRCKNRLTTDVSTYVYILYLLDICI